VYSVGKEVWKCVVGTAAAGIIVLHFVLLPQLTVLASTVGGAQEEAGTRRAGPIGSHGDTSRCE